MRRTSTSCEWKYGWWCHENILTFRLLHLRVHARQFCPCEFSVLKQLLTHSLEHRLCTCVFLIQEVLRNSELTYQHATAMFCGATNSFPGNSLAAAAACCHSGFHFKWDTVVSNIKREQNHLRVLFPTSLQTSNTLHAEDVIQCASRVARLNSHNYFAHYAQDIILFCWLQKSTIHATRY
jgi:hypothetical protein